MTQERDNPTGVGDEARKGNLIGRWLLGAVRAYFVLVSHNWLTLFGATFVTASAGLTAVFMVLSVMGVIHSPYLGILSFMVLPGIFLGGLLMVPVGVYWQRRKERGSPTAEGPHAFTAFPILDFNNRRLRDSMRAILVLSAINFVVISIVSYQGVVYTESREFCGQVCHTVMEPEFTAYLNSPHSNVECVACHIGPGASWFAKSKISGIRQIFAVALDTYTRPIETPVHGLRPSKDTCEVCHRPDQFTGDRIRVVRTHLEDEANSPIYSVLSMHVGGGNDGGKGIHSWHVSADKTTTYLATDEERQEIPLVRVTDAEGNVTEFKADGVEVTEEMMAQGEWRVMDCIDCHNRPSHIFRPAVKVVDEHITSGRIDITLPYIKKVGVEALLGSETVAGVGRYVREYYARESGDVLATRGEAVDAAVAALEESYRQNVFPEMDVTWGTYENNIGHTESIGCFRCHDDSHMTPDGGYISQDCTSCHSLLAWEEEEPEILMQLGYE